MAWTQTELVGGVPSPPPWPAVCSVQIIEHNSANTIALLKMFISCCIGEFNGNANGMKAHESDNVRLWCSLSCHANLFV